MSFGRKILNFLGYMLIFMSFATASALITFAIAIRGGKVYVPKLTGLPVQQAEKEAAKYELVVKVVASREEEGIAPGTVISQDPYPGFEIKKGGEIQVVICKGGEEINVPNFTGKKLEEVRLEIQDLGLHLGVLTQIFSPASEPSTVISQIPPPGKKTIKDSYIDLLVSEPYEEAFVMPDFIGKEFSTVQIYLKDMGFKVATPDFIKYPGWEHGIIVKQLPFPGYKITRNQIISFKVTR